MREKRGKVLSKWVWKQKTLSKSQLKASVLLRRDKGMVGIVINKAGHVATLKNL